MEITKIFYEGKSRVETGVIQFGSDWQGLFIRGDDCLTYAMTLKNIYEGKACLIYNDKMKELIDLLLSVKEH